jgi:PPOX class probable F420-dependent enzyme
VEGHLSTLPPWAGELLERARVARLGLLDDDDCPRVLPVTFAVHGGSVWSVVDDKPKRVPGPDLARVRFLRRRPQAALCVDHYDDDWTRLAWVQVLGTVDVLEVASAPAGMEGLEAKYPPYRDRRPAGPLLRMTPHRALCWRAEDSERS